MKLEKGPKNAEDWKALAKRQLTLILIGALGVIVSGLTKKLMASDLMRVEEAVVAEHTAAVEVETTEVVAWESFDAMIRYYEDRIDGLEERLEACEE